MKSFIFIFTIALSIKVFSAPATYVGAIGVPGGNILSSALTIRPLPTLNNQFDSIGNVVEVAMVTAHELAHVIQQRGGELKRVIDETRNGSGDESFKNLLALLFKDGVRVDVSDLSNYILQEAFLKDSQKLFSAAKNYGQIKNEISMLEKTLADLNERASKCEQDRGCSISELPKIKVSIEENKKNKVGKMAQMNIQFLALQEATQMESRKYQTLSNASKARHDIALNSIRNMK